MSVRRISTMLAVVFAAGSAVPMQASAARLTLDRACYVNHDESYLARVHRGDPHRRLPLFAHNLPALASGRGFPAGATVTVQARSAQPGAEAETVTVRADRSGAFRLALPNPDPGFDPPGAHATRFTVQATARGRSATARSRYTQGGVRWTEGRRHGRLAPEFAFAGFTAGRPVWGHFLLGPRLRGTRRYGRAQGACGLLHVTAARLWPFTRLAPAQFSVQYDARRRFSPATAGRYRATYSTAG